MDANPDLEPLAIGLEEIMVEVDELMLHLQGGLVSEPRRVFIGIQTKYRHEAVADVLVDLPMVGEDRIAHAVK